ncbi:hypothetical protein CEXT_39911 [Caerostris extrusa]|uniref:Uncharacterized protein n=1 Tax=Caerostris extrusa TaxID=172846 RepID=A0AAV4SPY6_CAEEX|nr:hypothetical protein CEXT_39911 [Caerostris extrusa]
MFLCRWAPGLIYWETKSAVINCFSPARRWRPSGPLQKNRATLLCQAQLGNKRIILAKTFFRILLSLALWDCCLKKREKDCEDINFCSYGKMEIVFLAERVADFKEI